MELKKIDLTKKKATLKARAEARKKEANAQAQQVQRFESIGATINFGKGDSTPIIIAHENISLNKLFTLINEELHLHKWECYIKDTENEDLITIVRTIGLGGYITYFISLVPEKENKSIAFKTRYLKQVEKFIYCYLENHKIKLLDDNLVFIIKNGINKVGKLSKIGNTIEEQVHSALESSKYDIEFQKSIDCVKDNDMLIVDYELPNMSNIPDIKEYKYIASKKEISIKKHTDSYISKRYEDVLYSITLRSLYEIFSIDTSNEINGVTFNGYVTQVNPATGITEKKCILSIQVDKKKFSLINLSQVEPKACFKALKGVSAAKLVNVSPITPILTFNKKDRRFIEGKDISVNQGTNLAAMHWEDFEHLVRELFEMEFGRNGGEVRVTQASRDGGVDAIIFDPDPLRGGKIVVQAKRYTNTVGVSAVRDLYGTVINEGANTGILITTSDYGHDSYEFAKDKPLKLLNGGHLLALLHKNGRNAHINIEEAKKINEERK